MSFGKDRSAAAEQTTTDQKDNGFSVIPENSSKSTKNWKKPRDNRKIDQEATKSLINSILKRG